MKRLDPRSTAAFAHDLVAASFAWAAAYWLRFNLDWHHEFYAAMAANLPWAVLLHAAVFWGFGLYRDIWRYASLPDLRRIILAVAFATASMGLAVLVLQRPGVPRSVFLLHPLLLVAIMGGSRLA